MAGSFLLKYKLSESNFVYLVHCWISQHLIRSRLPVKIFCKSPSLGGERTVFFILLMPPPPTDKYVMHIVSTLTHTFSEYQLQIASKDCHKIWQYNIFCIVLDHLSTIQVHLSNIQMEWNTLAVTAISWKRSFFFFFFILSVQEVLFLPAH